ncbi:hypothetical protein [Niabella aurantiaca]|uniref:hypothetical protein n=1 Tax=Niabella aurantiaca TaxID=379900 RepID=UPI000593C79F|nr:hypothetical protein [Niabella aurantiaca]
MRRKTLLTILLFTNLPAFSQDTIFLTDQRKLYAKVYEVNRIFVKLLFPGNKSFRRITLSVVDSIKYEDGSIDETVSNYWLWRHAAQNARREKSRIAREKAKRAVANRKRRNSFIDPNPNGFSIGAQAISTSLFMAKVLSRGADISAALGMHATYERTLVKNRVGIAASGFWSWNQTATGGMITAKYFPVNRPAFRLGAGPMFAYSKMYFRPIKKGGRYRAYDIDTDPDLIHKDTTIQTRATSIGATVGVQINTGKRFFIAHDFFVGVTNYENSSSEKAIFMYRLGFGIRF